MLAGLADREAQLRVGQGNRRHRAALRRLDEIGGADVGALAEPEGQDARRVRPRRGDEPFAMAAVMRDDRGAARLEAGEDLRLGVGDLFLAGEELAVRRGYRRDQG